VSAKQIHKVINREVNKVNAPQYRMSINLRIDGLSLLIIQAENVINAFDYSWQESDWSTCVSNLNELFSTLVFINYDYQSIDVFIESEQSTIVPNDFFNEELKQDLLNTYLGSSEYTAYSHKLINEKATVIFGVNTELLEVLSKFLKSPIFHSSSAMFIDEGLLKNKGYKGISLIINTNKFEIIANNENGLLGHNNFYYKTIDEFMFMLLSFAKQKDFDINTVKLSLHKELVIGSEIDNQLKRFFGVIDYYDNKLKNQKEKAFSTLIKYTIIANS